jgi:hypothetical protein
MSVPAMTARRCAALAVCLAAELVAGTAAPARAQAPGTDPRWQAWLGCWAPTAAQTRQQGASPRALLVCVVPAAGSTGVDVATVADTEIVSRDRIEATGEHRDVTRDGCTGWESAQWSNEGVRVYLRSELTCQGNLRRRSNGVMALSPEGEWLDARSVTSGKRTGLRVLRYGAAPLPAALPAEIAAALRGSEAARGGAATPATAGLTTADIAEESRQLDAVVVEAWLAETGQDFAMDGRRLIEAKRAGVPGDVIDVMVALSYPRVFTVNPASGQAEFRQPAEGARAPSGYTYAGPGYSSSWGGYYYSPYGWDSWWPYGWNPYSPFYSPYGAYGYSPWYGGYGGWYGGWYYGGGGGVLIVQGNGPAVNHGQVVKGRGYTQGGGSTGRDAHPRSTPSARSDGSDSGGRRSSGGSPQPSSGGSQPASSGGGSNSGGSAQPSSGGSQPRSQPASSGGGSNSGGGRTAKPRGPGR